MTSRPLHVIARDVRRDWGRVNFAAVPYLDAMGALETVDDYYGDPYSSVDALKGRYVVLYFLSNASTWRGPVARKVKSELRAMVDGQTRKATCLCGRKAAKYPRRGRRFYRHKCPHGQWCGCGSRFEGIRCKECVAERVAKMKANDEGYQRHLKSKAEEAR